MRKSTALVAVLALALAGCVDLYVEYTINPDGSGMVKIRCISSPVSFNLSEKKSPEEIMKANVRETLEQSAGVDAWSDVQAAIRDDGKMSFTGTAYFKDIEQLKLKVMGVSSQVPELVYRKEKDGTVSVEVTGEKKEQKAAEPPGNLNEDQIKVRMREERAKYQQGKPILEVFLKDVKFRNRVNLPGAVGEAHNFKKVGPSAVEVSFDGNTLLKVLDGLILDDAYVRKSIEEGRDLKPGTESDTVFMEKLFGENAPIKAVTKGPLKPAFDYEAEAAPARKNLPEFLKKYVAVPGPIPAAAGAGFKNVRVAGVQIVHVMDGEREIKPFDHKESGLSLSIVAELSGAALSTKEGKLLRATADTGENLLSRDDWDRKIHFPQLSNDKKSIVFEVHLGMPGPKAAGIKEISGSIQYKVADKTKEVDLGIPEFKKGSKGTEFGTEIGKIEESTSQEGRQELELKLKLAHEDVESVSFFDGAGKILEVSDAGSSSSGQETTLKFRLQGKFPAKGKIVARVFDEPNVISRAIVRHV
jgi:hypothetical protein